MNAYQANLYLPLIAAGFYLVLLILPQIRRRPDKSQTIWLIIGLILSIGWEFAIYFENIIPIANFSNIVLLLSVASLAATTGAFLDWQPG